MALCHHLSSPAGPPTHSLAHSLPHAFLSRQRALTCAPRRGAGVVRAGVRWGAVHGKHTAASTGPRGAHSGATPPGGRVAGAGADGQGGGGRAGEAQQLLRGDVPGDRHPSTRRSCRSRALRECCSSGAQEALRGKSCARERRGVRGAHKVALGGHGPPRQYSSARPRTRRAQGSGQGGCGEVGGNGTCALAGCVGRLRGRRQPVPRGGGASQDTWQHATRGERGGAAHRTERQAAWPALSSRHHLRKTRVFMGKFVTPTLCGRSRDRRVRNLHTT